jgi:hypothetical protein
MPSQFGKVRVAGLGDNLLSQFPAILSTMAHLKIYGGIGARSWQAMGMDDAEWLPLLHLFTAVQTLYIPEELSGHIILAREDVAKETATDVLPALSLLCLENQPCHPSKSSSLFSGTLVAL